MDQRLHLKVRMRSSSDLFRFTNVVAMIRGTGRPTASLCQGPELVENAAGLGSFNVRSITYSVEKHAVFLCVWERGFSATACCRQMAFVCHVMSSYFEPPDGMSVWMLCI